jgi:hypothetical protein
MGRGESKGLLEMPEVERFGLDSFVEIAPKDVVPPEFSLLEINSSGGEISLSSTQVGDEVHIWAQFNIIDGPGKGRLANLRLIADKSAARYQEFFRAVYGDKHPRMAPGDLVNAFAARKIVAELEIRNSQSSGIIYEVNRIIESIEQ